MGLGTQIPIYVTRKNADGDAAEWRLAAWMSLLVMFLIWLNAVLWGIVGVLTAVKGLL